MDSNAQCCTTRSAQIPSNHAMILLELEIFISNSSPPKIIGNKRNASGRNTGRSAHRRLQRPDNPTKETTRAFNYTQARHHGTQANKIHMADTPKLSAID